MREVQCLAQLDHKNIVRYHTSWLESGWVENGMGHSDGQHGCNFSSNTAKRRRTSGGIAGDVDSSGGRSLEERHRVGLDPMTSATAHALATVGGVGPAAINDSDSTIDGSLRARMDALVPAHMQPQLITGLENMVRPSGDSASESDSGWGWAARSDAGYGFGSGGTKLGEGGAGLRQNAAAAFLRGNLGGERRGSMSPQILSPKGLLFPSNKNPARDRGFSRWSIEDVESETSKWSETSSCFGLDCDISVGSSMANAAATTAFRVRGGDGGSSGPLPRSSGHRWTPSVVRPRRSAQFRNPSIDIDDIVSFGNSSPSLGETLGVEDGYDENNNDGWREWDAASSSDTLGGEGGNQRRGGGCGRHCHSGEKHLMRHSTSSDTLVQHPVTLYIQMSLCTGDTLQDWLRKRNMRLSSETEVAGSGVLFEDGAHVLQTPQATTTDDSPDGAAGSEISDFVASAGAFNTITPAPGLQSPSPGPDRDGGDKAHETLASSSRTNPITSASSETSDEASDNSSTGCCGSGRSEGTLCPPPTRETNGHLGSDGSSEQGFGTTVEHEYTTGATTSNALPTPYMKSQQRQTGSCEGRSAKGTARVDLHQSLSLFRQLVDGVSHIHSKGIIHRDIKVCNYSSFYETHASLGSIVFVFCAYADMPNKT